MPEKEMILMGMIEHSYGFVFKNLLRAINPIKKKIIKTECKVHQFINNQAVSILKNDGYFQVHNLMNTYINELNSGVIWADQDFKSSNHFYNPYREKGMFGCGNAQKDCLKYYQKALHKYSNGNMREAMFYLGAACHLVQDMTVPQHVNVKLLNSHRKYEQWVIRAYDKHDAFKAYKGGIYLNTIKKFIDINSKSAISIYKSYRNEQNRNIRFYNITSVILVLAQKTTAGMMLKFYNDTNRNSRESSLI